MLNAGSSTLKASVLQGLEVSTSTTVPLHAPDEAHAALRHAVAELTSAGADVAGVRGVGHRVVHGGAEFTRTTLIDDEVLRRIRGLASLAPLHNPAAAEVIAAARTALSTIPHAAAFDSAFHATLPREAYIYALPYEWFAKWGYRRYGFHGLSVTWSTERAVALLPKAEGLVVAHLGAGCSVTAVWQRRSVATTMGMTPLDGLVMGTRAGSVDPGVLLAAQRDHALDPRALEDVLERRSGLLGVSGRTAEMRELVTLAGSDERAALALSIFERSAAAAIAAAATALPRLDAIVFTGGIGENATVVRDGIVQRLRSIGVTPTVADPTGTADRVLVAGPIAVLVVLAREDVVIAREVRALID